MPGPAINEFTYCNFFHVQICQILLMFALVGVNIDWGRMFSWWRVVFSSIFRVFIEWGILPGGIFAEVAVGWGLYASGEGVGSF